MLRRGELGVVAGLSSCRTAVAKRRPGFDVHTEGCGVRETREDEDEDKEVGGEERGSGVGDTKAGAVMAIVRPERRWSVRTARDEEGGCRWGLGVRSNQEMRSSDRTHMDTS